MKSKWAKAGTVLFAAAVMLSSCSNDEVVPDGGIPVGERDAVKTSFSFAIPSPVSRATGADVQDGQGSNKFLGMKNLKLMPFALAGGADDYVVANSIIAGDIQLTSATIDNSESDNFVKTFTDVVIPSGDIAFLFYGEANHDTQFNGKLNMTEGANVTTPADIEFSLQNIEEGAYTGGTYETADALIEAWKTNVTDALATWVATFTDENEDKTKATTLQDNYFKFNSASLMGLQLAAQYLSSELGSDDYTSMTGASTLKGSIDGMITELAQGAYTNFPANLPKGTYKLENGLITIDENGPSGSSIVASTASNKYYYPSSLYYWTNAYPVAYETTPVFSNWSNGTYTGARTVISTNTTKIALNKTINYGVARLDVKAAIKANGTTIPAGKINGTTPTSVTLADHNFIVKGVLVGGLPDALDWEMHPSTGDTYSRAVYDTRMNKTDYELTNAATPDWASLPVAIYSLLPETADASVSTEATGATPNIALEILNDGPQFYGLDGNLIPEGGTFYLAGKLTYKADSGKPDVVRVLQQDYNTTVQLTISSLAKAYNTVPDLINPRLELALAVDIEWEAGLVLDVPLGD